MQYAYNNRSVFICAVFNVHAYHTQQQCGGDPLRIRSCIAIQSILWNKVYYDSTPEALKELKLCLRCTGMFHSKKLAAQLTAKPRILHGSRVVVNLTP